MCECRVEIKLKISNENLLNVKFDNIIYLY